MRFLYHLVMLMFTLALFYLLSISFDYIDLLFKVFK